MPMEMLFFHLSFLKTPTKYKAFLYFSIDYTFPLLFPQTSPQGVTGWIWIKLKQDPDT